MICLQFSCSGYTNKLKRLGAFSNILFGLGLHVCSIFSCMSLGSVTDVKSSQLHLGYLTNVNTPKSINYIEKSWLING